MNEDGDHPRFHLPGSSLIGIQTQSFRIGENRRDYKIVAGLEEILDGANTVVFHHSNYTPHP
jgi:hypothetical protein